MGKSLDEFSRHLTDSTLATPEEVAECRTQSQSTDGAQFARWLVRKRKLTAYQAQQVYAGKGRSLVLGNYVILDKLGQGGMGVVLKAEHRRMKRLVALKLFAPLVVRNGVQLQRFQREVQAAARLVHPHIVQAYDADEVRGKHFLVLEFVPGTDLDSLIKSQGPLPVDQALNCLQQAARGLEYAHQQGVIHRDIKPSNLLLDEQGHVKILDMGLARLAGDGDTPDGITVSGTVMGTVDYMAPEQAENTHTAGIPADIYSLGCTLHFLLTGRAVYDGERMMQRLMAHRDQPIPSLSALRPEVPADVDALFSRMVAKSPQQRYASMSDVITAIGNCRSPAADEDLPNVTFGANEDTRFAAFLQGLESGTLAASTLQQAVGQTHVAATTSESSTLVMTCDRVETDTQVAPRTVSSRRQPPSRPGRRLHFRWWPWATGAVVLAGILITITRKDGSQQTIRVPEGATVQITQDSAPAEPPAPMNPNHAAAEWVLSVGGKLKLIDWKGTSIDVRKAPLPPGDWQIAQVDLEGCQQVTEDDLQRFAGCENLNTLNLGYTMLTGTGLSHLQHMTSLRSLMLSDSKISDETATSLEHLPHLTTLYLPFNQLTDKALIPVGRLTHLDSLHLGSCDQLTDAGAAHLRSLTRLRTLAISGTRISDAGLSQLLIANPDLAYIEVGTINDRSPVHALTSLAAGQSLTRIVTSGDLLTAEAVPVLQQLPRLEAMMIVYPVNAEAVKQLAKLTNVRSLELFQTRAGETGPGDAGYAALAVHPTLKDLTIFGGGGSPTDAALASLAKLPKLRRLTLNFDVQDRPRSYTSAGIDAFRTARPDVHLHVDGQDYPPTAPAT